MSSEEPEKNVEEITEVVDHEDPNLEPEVVPANTDGDTEIESEKMTELKPPCTTKDDVILIHPNNVLKALRAFVEKYKSGDHKYISFLPSYFSMFL